MVPGLQAVVIDIDSAWIGKSVSEVHKITDAKIVLVSHHNKSFVPHQDYRIQLGDALAVHFPK